MNNIRPFTRGPRAAVRKLNDIVGAANKINSITGDGLIKVTSTGSAITLALDVNQLRARMPKVGGGTSGKVFKIQSNATGDGVYNCYEQKLTAANWEDTTGEDKFADKNTEQVEVLNLSECSPKTDVHHALSAGTLLNAWQITDDSGTTRWVGQVIILWDFCGEA